MSRIKLHVTMHLLHDHFITNEVYTKSRNIQEYILFLYNGEN